MVATKNRFPQNSTYVLCGHKESGASCTVFSYIYKKLRLGNMREMQSSIVRKHSEPVESGPYWHVKRSEVPGQLHSTITPQMLHHEQKYSGMLSTSYWETDLDFFLRMTRFLLLITS